MLSLGGPTLKKNPPQDSTAELPIALLSAWLTMIQICGETNLFHFTFVNFLLGIFEGQKH
jgi:hypothetical protein